MVVRQDPGIDPPRSQSSQDPKLYGYDNPPGCWSLLPKGRWLFAHICLQVCKLYLYIIGIYIRIYIYLI